MILFLWLKGIGCAVCCTTEAIKPLCHTDSFAKTSTLETQSNESRINESACHERNCCKPLAKRPFDTKSSSSTDESAPLQVTTSGELKVCSLLASQTLAFTVSPKSLAVPVAETPPGTTVSATIFQANHPDFTQPFELRNRSGTYLRCCVLLI